MVPAFSRPMWRRSAESTTTRLIDERDRLQDLLGRLRSTVIEQAAAQTHDVTDDEAMLQADAIETRLAEVLAALARIGAGDYGRCRVCGSDIADERLDVLPAAETCAACAASGPPDGRLVGRTVR